MVRKEKPNFVASRVAPNHKEVAYWIDLTEGPDGQIIKTWVNNTWVKINENENSDQNTAITTLQSDLNSLKTTVNNKADKSTVTSLTSTVNNKANKSTTLSGYGITNAYTKTEVDNLINALQERVAALEAA